REMKEQGHRLVLATAADEGLARRVSEHLLLFDDVVASDGRSNLKGEGKLRAIRRLVGTEFVYAGDSRADRPIWRAAGHAGLVRAGPRLARSMRGRISI